MRALRLRKAGCSRGAIAIAGIFVAGAPAWSFGAGSSRNPDYLAMLPANVQKIVVGRCNGAAHPHQYFATFFYNSAEMHLHYDRLSCDGPNRFCTPTGCLHEVYVRHGGGYMLSRSYYGR
ncbi:hypothetical protein [Bradyrhizobium commune]|uniref:Uncharacterized protein n=1 Tax=Bradyrhizobium commune TaxID=83627 RepID=A0A7S9D2Q2_9BRAD|nr:hypothetical protein [Bradyrhizobium commune]QPF90122.1 hypothetical protein IC761_26965 [Bradyrhizobium commune]